MSEHRIAVLHPDCLVYGGAEAVCFATLQALQDDYDITLFTLVPPAFERLNDHFGTAVDREKIAVETVSSVVPWLYDNVGKKFGVLAAAYFNRRVREAVGAYDLAISTKDEFAIDGAVQYVHFPRFYREELPEEIHPDTLANAVYDRVCRATAGFSKASLDTAQIVTNSAWTADVIRDIYGVDPAVIYPPVNTERFTDGLERTPEEWADREDGFVTLGRITPDKNVVETIDLLVRLVERGHDVHLHVVGPEKGGRFDRYADDVRTAAAPHDFVHLERKVRVGALVDMLQSHKYGLHGKRHEHFGMSVAEMVAAGMLPFVPDSGGQTDIIDGREALMYGDVADGVETIAAVLSDAERQRELRSSLPDATTRYGRERFEREIQTLVSEALAT